MIDYDSAPPNLTTLPRGSLFKTWRPKAHVLSPSGQVGDPCMHYTDPETGLFHVGWLHNGAAGATTNDLVHYTDINNGDPFITPGGINDPIAVFDGSVIPKGINGKPTLLYTSVSFLPIQWTIPYTRGSETQSLAVSTDGGQSFTKLPQGPVIPSPPFGVDVTGFRDPYVFQNPQLDALLESKAGTWYVVLSGGIHGEGPSQFLYRQYTSGFQYWEELGQWWYESANSTWGNGEWAGRWGFNFEISNVLTLDEQGFNPHGQVFTTVGAEWSRTPIVPHVSDFRDMLWAQGSISVEGGKPKFTPEMAGKLDWGTSAYAAAGKDLPASSQPSKKSGAPDRFITYLWLTGDLFGMSPFLADQQGWSGALLLPRELSVGMIRNVVDNELSRETGSWKVVKSYLGLVELATLKQVIAREPLAALKSGISFKEPDRTLGSSGSIAFQRSPKSKFFVLIASLSFPQSARHSNLKAGFSILSSEHERTLVYFSFPDESIIIDHTNSSAASQTTPGIDSRNEVGRLRLFDVITDGMEQMETLELTIVVDNAIVEVHANERFALSTWVWSWYANSTNILFYHDGDGEVSFQNVIVYDGLYDAWPFRSV